MLGRQRVLLSGYGDGGVVKIAFVTREFPPSMRAGGIATYVWEVARFLSVKGHEVFVVCASDDCLKESREKVDGVTVIRLAGGDFYIADRPSLVGRLRALARQLLRFVSYRRRVSRTLLGLVRDQGVQIVEFPEYGSEAFYWSLTKSPVPWVVRLHGPTLLDRATGKSLSPIVNPLGWIFGNIELLTLRRATALTSPSKAMADFVHRIGGVNMGSIAVIPNAVAVEKWLACGSYAERSPKKITIFSAGTLVEGKGYRELVLACCALRQRGYDISLSLAGRLGRLGRELEDFGRQPGFKDWLKIIGLVDRDSLRSHYADASLVVFPSWWEPFGIVCVEAMASGALVLGSTAGGMSEIIDDGVDGFLVPPMDVSALTNKIEAIIGLPDVVTFGVRANAVEKAAQWFSTEHVMNSQMEFYRRIIDSESEPHS